MIASEAFYWPTVRTRMECSEHVNSFIDVYWAYILKKTHHWKIAFKLVSVDTVTNPPKNIAFSNMASIICRNHNVDCFHCGKEISRFESFLRVDGEGSSIDDLYPDA